jgi:hypothetical protein
VPRLSIVVPFAGDESLLHATLLSILENRPTDCEIIVAHDGSYHDPYRLLHDELIDIEVLDCPSTIGLINEAVLAAVAPIVQVLLPGSEIECDWVEEPLSLLDADPLISGVMLPSHDDSVDRSFFGFDMTALPRRIELAKPRYRGSATPAINGTFFRRKILRMLDGFLDAPSVENCEIEFGLAMRSLGLEAVIADETELDITACPKAASQTAFARGQVYGRIALAYSKLDSSGVEINSMISRLGHLAGGLMNPSTVAERLGWVMGLTDTKLVRQIRMRIEGAATVLDLQSSDTHSGQQTIPVSAAEIRRAA